jgi:hypothetical protein
MKWRIWIHKVLYRLGLRTWIMRSEDFEPGTLVYIDSGVAYPCTGNSPLPLGIAMNTAPKGGRVNVLLRGFHHLEEQPQTAYVPTPGTPPVFPKIDFRVTGNLSHDFATYSLICLIENEVNFERAAVEIMEVANVPVDRVKQMLREHMEEGATLEWAQEAILKELRKE